MLAGDEPLHSCAGRKLSKGHSMRSVQLTMPVQSHQDMQKTITMQKSTIDMLVEENHNLKIMIANLTGQSFHSQGSDEQNFESPSHQSFSEFDTYESYLSESTTHASNSRPSSPKHQRTFAMDIKSELEKSGIRLNNSCIWVPPSPKKRLSRRDSMRQDLNKLREKVKDVLRLS
ncbi:hypothetical protein AKO1_014635 [Acrasis kona]|uniref:Uncharacterized protein n=1 Tax=Acrasis kona TaxID=1008807 RepID=A0AAW2Z1X6_9EUKA